MEKITDITEQDLYTEDRVWCEIECCMCGKTREYTAYTKEGLLHDIKEEGWTNIDSDRYKIIGHLCEECNV